MRTIGLLIAFGLLAVGGTAVAIYFVCLGGSGKDPGGMYSSFEFFGHDERDVLEFKDGVVTLRTCCGEDDYGTYWKETDGTWTWHYLIMMTTMSDPTPRVHRSAEFVVIPQKYSVRIERVDDRSIGLTMRRRLFTKLKL